MRPRALTPAFLILANLMSFGTGRAQDVDRNVTETPHAVRTGHDWQTASPESQGLSRTALDAVAAYAEQAGGGSGCVVRHGFLVKE